MNQSDPLRRYLTLLRRWWPVLVSALILGVIAGVATLPDGPASQGEPVVEADPGVSYQASHLLIRARESTATENLDLVVMLARQGEVVERVVERVESEEITAADVGTVELEAAAGLGTLEVRAIHTDPEIATQLADAYATTIVEYFGERADVVASQRLERATARAAEISARVRELEDEIAGLDEGSLDRQLAESELAVLIDQYGQVRTGIRDLSLEEVSQEPAFDTLQEPVAVPTEPPTEAVFEVPERPLARVALLVFLAVLAGLGLIFAIDRFDTRVRSRADAEEAFGLPVLAEIPERRHRDRNRGSLSVTGAPGSEEAEAFRSLKLAVQLSSRWRLQRDAPTSNGTAGTASRVAGNTPPATLLVTSSVTGEGKTTVAGNLAASFAESGYSVLVVDSDFRRARAHEILGGSRNPGLGDLPRLDDASLRSLIQDTAAPNVSLISAGGSGLAPAWLADEGARLVQLARELADVVVFDTSPLLTTNEATALSASVDAVLLVSRSRRTTAQQAYLTTEKLTRLHANVAGVILLGGEATRSYGYYEPIRRAGARRPVAR